MRKIYIFFFIVVLLSSCAKEDPNLVNPPPPYQSIRIRLLNAVNGTDKIAWGYDSKPLSNFVEYLGLTKAIMPPPYDSIKIDFFQNNTLVYTTPRKVRLVRETRYLLVAGKSFKEGSIVDTFMVLSTTYGLPKKLGKSYFKFVNLVRDSNLKVSLIEGCPNGKALVSNVPYFSYPFLQTIPYGSYIFSVVTTDGFQNNLVNIYSVNFQEDNEYTLFFAQKLDGSFGLFFYDDYDTTATALTELHPIPERNAFLRVANFSTDNISVGRFPAQNLVSNLGSMQLSPYIKISACESESPDSLEVETTLGKFGLSYSFEVFKKYTLVVFDSTVASKKIVMVPPLKLNYSLSGNSAIRVLNALDTNFAITLSIGARQSDNAVGYSSGEVLASNLKSGIVSPPVLVRSGYLPLTLFSATEPAFLINSVFANVEANRSYLVVVFKSSDGTIQLSLIEDEQSNLDITLLENGCFVQFVNAFPTSSKSTFTLNSILANAKLSYKESFATVLPLSISSVLVDGQEFPLKLDLRKTGLFVLAGGEVPELFDVSIPSLGAERTSFRRRFFNASKDVDNIAIYYDSSKTKTIVNELRYGFASQVERIFLERKFSLVVVDNNSGKIVSQFNDIFLSFGKNYTLIFAGKKSMDYSLIVIQEY